MQNYVPDFIQQRALETWHTSGEQELIHATLGLAGEVGEVVEDLKKHLYKAGHNTTRERRIEEYGDVLYYLAILLHLERATFQEVSNANYNKLIRKENHHGWGEKD